MSDIQFFGEVDIHPTKHVIMSEYPAWTMTRQFENMKEDVDRMERQLKRGEIPDSHIADHKDMLRKKREQFEKIADSIPKMSDGDKDKVAKTRKEMGKVIQSGYFTRSAMMKGTADAQVEATRMIKPLVDVKPEFAEYVRAANVPITNGKITRDGLVKTWKIMGHLLNHYGGEEEINAETLRRD